MNKPSQSVSKIEMSPLPIFIAVFSFFALSACSSSATTAPETAASCSTPFRLFVRQNYNITNCRKLATLGAEFAWELIPGNRSQFQVIFGARLSDDVAWVAWGVNPTRPKMVGTRAMIGVRDLATGLFRVAPYNVTWQTRKRCGLHPNWGIDVEFRNASMEYLSGIDYYAMRATVGLPSAAAMAGSTYNVSRLNHVWQVGYSAEGMEPRIHPVSDLQHFDSKETIDLRTGAVRLQAGRHRRYLRTVHGILSMIGWGTILPVGAIIARYSKFPVEAGYPRWFLAHKSCQLVGYAMGIAGWILGILLGNSSVLYAMKVHRLYAIFILAFATLQVTALFFKPGKGDEYRKYWNLYHHFLGYGLLSVIVINNFKGIAILKPNYTWKWAYIGILACLAGVALAMEMWSWIKFMKMKKESNGIIRPNYQVPTSSSTYGKAPSTAGGEQLEHK
ncbi:unnamed protein product [Linum tenue]|uniref:Cytochrome b561 and DOMON domain-containing protein n=1 Tax=Linum tenue TaxID=586396 RepID=A0AAV0H2B6_9ROSI|nr:unnamed protein product [Linum tenue]